MFDKYGNLLVGQGSAQSGGLPYLALPPGWDAGWQAAKALASSSAQWLTVIGDSLSDGQNSTDYINLGWVTLLKNTLVARGLPLMGDFFPVTENVNFTPGWQGTPPFVVNATGLTWYSWEMGRLPFYSPGNGLVTFTCPYACTELDIVFFDQSAGTFTYILDGGGAVTVVPNCTGAQYSRRMQLTGLSNIAHVISFQTQSGANVMGIQGVATYPTAASRSLGMGYGRCAYQAGALADFGNTSSQPSDMCRQWQGFGAATTGFGFPTQPQLAIIEFGINDAAGLYGVQSYRRTLERLVNALRRGSPNCSIAMMAGSDPDGINSDVTSGFFGQPRNYGLYTGAMRECADTMKCAFVDVSSKWGQTGVAQGFQAANNPHPTNAGHADIAALFASML